MENKLTTVLFHYRKKLLKTMMRTFIFLFCSAVFSITPSNVLSQNTKIKIDEDKTVTVDEVFDIIMNQTDYVFIYQVDMFKDFPKVKLKKGTVKANELLSKSLSLTDFRFNMEEGSNTIVIEKAPTVKEQQITVIGKIVNVQGEPIPGISVFVTKNKPIAGKINQDFIVRGTVTDFEGNFNLLVEDGYYIAVSGLGYEFYYEQVTADKTEFNIILKENISELEEVMVTGYQTISKERATGSFSKVSSETLDDRRLNNLGEVLEGRIAGLSNGIVRGTTTMQGITNPLYVIDGFPVEKTRFNSTGDITEDLPDLNLEDIESITVLKDAAASSIYGARAANGVVVIVTKKAAMGEENISFSSSLTVSPYKYYTGNLMDAADMIDLEKEYIERNPNLQNPNVAPYYAAAVLPMNFIQNQGYKTMMNFYAGNISESEMNAKLNSLSGMGYSFYDDVEKYAKRDPIYQQYNVSYGKGTDRNSFNASVTYKNNKYEDIYSKDESFGINLRNSTEVTKWLTVDLGTYVSYTKGQQQTFDPLNLSSLSVQAQPYDRLVNPDGTPYTFLAEDRYAGFFTSMFNMFGVYSLDLTPLDELGMNLMNKRNFINRSYAKFNIDITEGLKYSTMFQYEYGVDRANQLQDKNSFHVRELVNNLGTISSTGSFDYNLPYGDIYYSQDQFTNAYDFRQQLDFNKTFKDKHDLTAIAGMEIKETKLEYQDITLYGYDKNMLNYVSVDPSKVIGVSGSLGIGNAGLTQDNFASQRELLNRFVSLYGNAGYSYDRRYSLTGSVRWDRSNLWGTSNKYQNKPAWSLGAGWNINNEEFFNTQWVDMLKLRTSYGIGGNIVKGTAPYMTASYDISQTVGGRYGTINSRPNPELSWEKTATTNLGVDFALFNHRLSGSIDYYKKQSSHLLTQNLGIPTEGWGYEMYTVNNGEMVNNGIELMLNGTIIKKQKFAWDVSLIYAHNKNEVTSVSIEAPVFFTQLYYPESYPVVGDPFHSLYGYKDAGLSSTGLPQVYNSAGEIVTGLPYDLESIVQVGSTIPTSSGSFNTSFHYGNFDLSMLFLFQAGHVVHRDVPFVGSYTFIPGPWGYLDARNKLIANRWREAGDENTTDIPRAVFDYDSDFNFDFFTSSWYASSNYIDASNIRLSNISLAYRLPDDLNSKLNLKNIRLNFNVENVFMLAKSKEAKYALGGFRSPNLVLGLNVNF